MNKLKIRHLIRSLWSLLLGMVFVLNAFNVHAQSNEDCFMCHEDPDLTKMRNGKKVSLYVDSKIYKNSAHRNVECASCHTDAADIPHAENLKRVNCGSCHQDQALQAKNDIHHKLADRVGENAPDCKTCHNTHKIYNPSKIKDQSKVYCGKCHEEDMITTSYHISNEVSNSCLECHDEVHYTDMENSVHANLNCANCHSYAANNIEDHTEKPDWIVTADCYLCHRSISLEHKESIHGISLSEGIAEAANCWDCHGSHKIYAVSSDSSGVYPTNLAATCGSCHDDPEFGRKFFSTVKQPGKMFSQSVHGKLVEEGRMDAASCVTCHGAHDIKNRVQEGSQISAINTPDKCGECHEEAMTEYKRSIHWIAVKKGVRESPTCNDCHSEHSIQTINTVNQRVEAMKMQENTCLQCHQNLLLSQRFGLESEGASNYQDSYHGLAVMRGDEDAAMCIDCHAVHAILPSYHEESTIHENNVTETCKSCHTYATDVFSKSYSHVLDENSTEAKVNRVVTDVYTWLIIIVIGGMILHNIIIFVHDLVKKYRLRNKEIRIPRFNTNELIQHTLLLITFILLAITGFQLKYPESWWAEGLTKIGLDEPTRQLVHRICAVLMIILSFYHAAYLAFTARGRATIISFVPTIRDLRNLVINLKYNLGLSKKHPENGYYDYTEKAEYWALIWGTAVMGITGFILWFPTIVGDWAPLWTIRVAETIHFYEAILATLAIVVWHWFFVIFRPQEYPLSYTSIDGQMTITHYREEHKHKFKEIMVAYLEQKAGTTTKKMDSLSKIFIKSVEKAGLNFDDFIRTEAEKDIELKQFLESKNLYQFLDQ